MDHTVSVKSVGLDTLTCSAGGDETKPYLQALGVYLLMRSAAQGNKVGYFKRGPYVGGQTRAVGYAEHEGRGLVELRGEAARDWGLLLLPYADKVSRIDVQVTAEQNPYDPDLAWRAWTQAREKARAEGRPPRYTLWADASRGSTLYVGRLGSRFMGRVYEKGKEEPKGGWENCWRYEVQARRERAQQVADLARGMGNVQQELPPLVAGYFAPRGIQPIFDPSDPHALPPLPPEQSDTSKALRWLGQSVAPVLSRLYSSGDYDAALAALGIGRTLEHP